MAESTFETFTRLAAASPDGLEALTLADLGALKVFNKSLKTLCDETDEMDKPLHQESFDALVIVGQFQATLAKNRATAAMSPTETEMPAAGPPILK